MSQADALSRRRFLVEGAARAPFPSWSPPKSSPNRAGREQDDDTSGLHRGRRTGASSWRRAYGSAGASASLRPRHKPRGSLCHFAEMMPDRAPLVPGSKAWIGCRPRSLQAG